MKYNKINNIKDNYIEKNYQERHGILKNIFYLFEKYQIIIQNYLNTNEL